MSCLFTSSLGAEWEEMQVQSDHALELGVQQTLHGQLQPWGWEGKLEGLAPVVASDTT